MLCGRKSMREEVPHGLTDDPLKRLKTGERQEEIVWS